MIILQSVAETERETESDGDLARSDFNDLNARLWKVELKDSIKYGYFELDLNTQFNDGLSWLFSSLPAPNFS